MKRIVLAVALFMALFAIGGAAPAAMADTQTCASGTGLSGCSPSDCAANNRWYDENTYDPSWNYYMDTSCGDQSTGGIQPVDANASDTATDYQPAWDRHCSWNVYRNVLWRTWGGGYAEAGGAFWCDHTVLQMGIYVYLYEWWISDNHWHLMDATPVVGGPVNTSAHIHTSDGSSAPVSGWGIFSDVARAPCNTYEVRYWTAHVRGFYEDSVGGWWGSTAKPKSGYLACRS